MTFPTGPPMHPSMAQQDQVRHPTKAVRTVCGGQLRVPALQPCQPSNIDDNPGIVRMASSGRKQFLASILSGIRVSLQYEVWPFIFQRRRPSLSEENTYASLYKCFATTLKPVESGWIHLPVKYTQVEVLVLCQLRASLVAGRTQRNRASKNRPEVG
jgi:hypothetical protein